MATCPDCKKTVVSLKMHYIKGCPALVKEERGSTHEKNRASKRDDKK